VDPICDDGSRCGLMQIARMLEERKLKGTFFLNVYEYKAWGEPALRDIAQKLQSGGHEVALHTHPQWAYDPKRPNMYDYTLEEQTRIVAEGVSLLQSWTGTPVVSHRAGAYSANRDTLTALASNGIRFDSSWFFQHPNSRLAELKLPTGTPSEIGEIEEIPVSVYWRDERPQLLGTLAPALRSIRKLDPNWFQNLAEATSAIDASIAADPPFVVLFLHSFSFMAGPGANGVPAANPQSREMFGKMLDHIVSTGLQFESLGDVNSEISPNGPVKDIIPDVDVEVPLYKYVAHGIHMHGMRRFLPAAVLLIALCAGSLAVVLRVRRRKARIDGSAPG